MIVRNGPARGGRLRGGRAATILRHRIGYVEFFLDRVRNRFLPPGNNRLVGETAARA